MSLSKDREGDGGICYSVYIGEVLCDWYLERVYGLTCPTEVKVIHFNLIWWIVAERGSTKLASNEVWLLCESSWCDDICGYCDHIWSEKVFLSSGWMTLQNRTWKGYWIGMSNFVKCFFRIHPIFCCCDWLIRLSLWVLDFWFNRFITERVEIAVKRMKSLFSSGL